MKQRLSVSSSPAGASGTTPLLRAAEMLAARGDWRQALRAFQDVLARDAGNFSALCRVAQAQWMLGDPARGLPAIDRAIAQRPGQADAHHLRACMLQAISQADAAIEAYQRAVALKPDNVDALTNLGGLLCERRRYAAARDVYQRVLGRQPGLPQARNNLGVALLGMDRVAEALTQLDQAVALAPGFADAHANRGSALLSLGDVARAERAFETAIALAPRNGDFYLDLARCRRFAANDPYLPVMRRLADETGSLSADARTKLHFALGKAHADFGAVEPAFAHYQAGNALKRAAITYHETETLQTIARVPSLFPRPLLAASPSVQVPPSADDAFAPIFVVGMPRSGTTLVEQILASHALVFGAGERPDLHETALRAAGPGPPAALFDRLAGLPEASLREAGESYLRGMRLAAPEAARIVDKMPGNFLHLGLIALALPGARVIHVRRDRLDTCLSCYFTLFSGDQPYSYDLAELGRYYRAYEALMRHWRAALPASLLLDVGYEDLVADLEGETRRMLAHCGLAWDPACLRFQDTDRAVRTASRAQVRQPLYARSVGRAAAYAPWLGPLRAALEASQPLAQMRASANPGG